MDFLKEIEGVFDKSSGRQLAAFYTKKIDDLLIEIFNSLESATPLTLIAVGGYGRAELGPFSDIDIMFFAKDKSDSKKVEAMLYNLWDAGLTIGHSFRNAKDCIEEAKKDLRTHTSLLEARFIAGDKGLYNYFLERVYSDLAYKKQKNFISEKLKEMEKRHRDFGDSVFLLEPDVKEGQGGLRDIHTMLWLAKIALKLKDFNGLSDLITSHEFRRMVKAYDFLLKVRFCLHLMSGRKNDVLSFNTHDYIAKKLGFHDSKKFLGSERFMRYFYLKASVIRDITSTITGMCSKQWLFTVRIEGLRKRKVTDNFFIYKNVIISSGKDIFKKDADKMIEAFYVFSKTGKNFSRGLREEIRRSLLLLKRRIRSSQNAVSFFLEILRGKRVYATLREMHETGVLGRFIPEFGALTSLVVYAPYHRYTVDEHTIHAIKNLELLNATKYKNLEHLSGIIKGIKEKEILFMSLLLHDIGKAAGKYHEEEGYKRLKNIIERFNLDIEKRQRIEFLVRNHILMSSLALKRDTDDPEIIAQFADAVGDEESLRAIYLMTYADMSAVNPEFWTEWKAYLLSDLYVRTLRYLCGFRANPEAYVKNIISSYAGDDMEGLNDFIAEMPMRYLLSTPAGRVYEDYSLACGVRETGFAVSINEKPDNIIEITIGAWDCQGLFLRVVGFFSSRWMNIVRARLYTGKKGLVIDKIQISNWRELWWDGMDNAIKDGLIDVVLNKNAPVTVKIANEQKVIESMVNVFIELDNETSGDSSILEFFSSDRQGLLFDVSTLLFEREVNIISAKINTESGIAQDIFYIQHAGGKVNGYKAVEMISALWKMLKKD